MSKILFVTDLYYDAKGRRYYEEDLYLTNQLRDEFDLVLCHPNQVEVFEDDVDLIVLRNIGVVILFKEVYDSFYRRAHAKPLPTYNALNGSGDMKGKDYLVELTHQGYPVIPSIDTLADLTYLHNPEQFVIKPKDGADSIGMKILTEAELPSYIDETTNEMVIQPLVDFEYEVSFFYIDNVFHHAIYAPDKNKRWELVEYQPTPADLAFF